MKVIKISKMILKKTSLLLTLCLFFVSCNVVEHPEFIGMKNLKVVDKKFKSFTLSIDAIFENPNNLGGTLQTDDLKVFVNGIEAATVTTTAFDVPKKDKFTIPMTVKISTDKILNLNSIEGVLNSLKSKTLSVDYKGIIDYKLAGFNYAYDVDYTNEIKL